MQHPRPRPGAVRRRVENSEEESDDDEEFERRAVVAEDEEIAKSQDEDHTEKDQGEGDAH